MKADTPQGAPLRADLFTRLIYVGALAGFIFGSMSAASSWIGLALGGGIIANAGTGVFVLVATGVVYRIYLVLRYRTALDARPPNSAGWILRAIGWLLMAAGAVGTVSLFLVKPIALMIFKTPGDAGIAYFATGLFATMLAGQGPFGCAIFELSRVIGRKPSPPTQPRDASRRKQDLVVLGAVGLLAVLVMAWPSLLQITKGPISGHMLNGQCVAPVLLDCAAKIEASATRVAAVPAGGAVRLRSNIEAIEYHHPQLKQGVVMLEYIEDALARAGYRVAPYGEVFVDVDATTTGNTPVVVLRVADKSGEVARFTTTFAGGAKLESSKPGVGRVVVELGRNVMLPMRAMPGADGHLRFADGLYAQLRQAVVSEREAAVLSAAVARTATAGSSTSPPSGYKYPDRVFSQNCTGVAELRTQTAPEVGRPPTISRLHEISFTASGRTALLNHVEFVSCHGNAVWFIRQEQAPLLHVRRYDLQGNLQRAWRVALPQVPKDVRRFAEPDTLEELGGQVQLRMYVVEKLGVPKQQLQSFAFPI